MRTLLFLSAAMLFCNGNADAQYYFKQYDVAPGLSSNHPSQLTSFGGTLLYNAGSPTTKRELFKLQGNVVSLVKDINPETCVAETRYLPNTQPSSTAMLISMQTMA